MTARDYPCPDCEDALGPCSGFGCPAKGMETFPFRRVVVCAAPKRKPEPAVVAPVVAARKCEACRTVLPKPEHQGRLRKTCSKKCRTVRKRQQNAVWMRAKRAVSS